MDFWAEHWWLIFPIGWFIFGGLGMWLNYRRGRDAMEIMKSYAAQGREPPAEILRAASGESDPDDWRGGRHWRRSYRCGPLGEWRRVFIFGALATGFWFASARVGGGAIEGFTVVAVIMSALAVGSLFFAVLATVWKDK
jgi:hypothetical protein